MNVGLVTLGCNKNQVDSEMILGLFKNMEYDIVSDPSIADVIVVNTCGFIESAKKEAIDTILEMADYKEYGKCKALIVTGCLAKRYKKDILENMPEVDLCIGVDEYENIGEILSKFLNEKFKGTRLEFCDRIISSNFPLAYIRISDGCNNKCHYCAIPSIRGKFKSRKIEDILIEVENLANQGISEFCLISQDTSKYGIDIYNKPMLANLINKVSKIDGVKWIRVLYMYIFETTDDIINEIASNPKVCKYFDLPIQHISNKILKSMNRYDTKENIYTTIKKIRDKIPDAIIRTTVMVGYPGETEKDYEELRQGIIELQFDRLGAFAFSREEGTVACDMDGQIPESIKNERLKDIFDTQKQISLEKNKKRVGKEYEVIVESISEDDKYFVCRSYAEAPDVDGRIYIEINENSVKNVVVGEYTKIRIINYSDYDLFAEVI